MPDPATATGRLSRAQPGRSWVDWLTPTLVVLGIGLRLRQYLDRRSFWNDEAALALNVVRRGYRDLLRPLDLEQGAPLGFLWGQRAAVTLLGNNEFALRLLPFLSGTAALVLFAVLAGRLLTPWAAAAAVFLFATLGPLVYYSSEAKQYSGDVAVAVALILATVRLLDGPVSPRRALAWGAIGCVSVLLSHPSVLVLAACSLVAAAVLTAREGVTALRALAPGIALWVVELAVLYAVSLRHLAANPALEAFWQDGYAPRPLHPRTAAAWATDVVAGLVPNPVELSAPLVVLALFAVGVVVLLLRHLPAGLLVTAIAAAALAAGLVGVYPVKWRLALYLVPVVLLAIGASLDAGGLSRAAAVAVRLVAVAALAVIAVQPLGEAARVAVDPYTVTEMRSVLVHLRSTAQPTDAVYVHWTGALLYDYYAPVLGLPSRLGYFAWTQGTACSTEEVLAPLRAHPRVWVVFAFPPMYDSSDNAAASLSQLDGLGRRIDERTAPGTAQVVLYDTTATGHRAPSGGIPRPGDCLAVVQQPARPSSPSGRP